MTSLSIAEMHHRPDAKLCRHFRHHRLTCAEYDALRARAAGRCEICDVPEEETPRGYLVIDHFEADNGRIRFVRGLLCDRCNSVMSCVDGLKVWGPRARRWETRARAYEANSWQKPSPEALAAMAARKEKPPKNPPRRPPLRERMSVIPVPSRRGVPAMAERLCEWLTPTELAALAALLAEAATDGR